MSRNLTPLGAIPTVRRRRYSVVNLRFTGSRSFLSTTVQYRSSPTRHLQVVPDIVDVPVTEADGDSTPRSVTPVKVVRPLTTEEAGTMVGPLLPPVRPHDSGKLTLVLDLDETLVHAALPQSENVPPTAHDFSFMIDDVLGTGIRREVVVWKRPGLSKFLARASQLAEIVVFTASLKEYAAPLLDIVDPENHIAARLYRDSAVQTQCGVVKDLSLLGRDLSRVIIVDNDPVSFLRHPDNAILIRSFRATEDDVADASFAVLLKLLEELASLHDVRPALAARFGLRRFFRSISPDMEVHMTPPPSPTAAAAAAAVSAMSMQEVPDAVIATVSALPV